jgi:Zn-finger nucleic acid-binding protein
MVAYELEGVEIDRCLRCDGVWLDAGELEMVTEWAGADPGALAAALEASSRTKRSKRRCPRCGRKMRLVPVGLEGTLELDRCPIGHGLWFDRGELEKLIANFEDGEEGAVARFFADLFHYDLESTREGEV